MCEQACVSLVIPVYRDDAALSDLLFQVRQLTVAPLEVLVVDGGNLDSTRELCYRHKVNYLSSAPGRGLQQRLGARQAKGDVLWFVHADAGIANSAIEDIQMATSQGSHGGYFKFRFKSNTAAAYRLLAGLINFRCRFGVPYGDQGIFVGREVYWQLEGHNEYPLFEEVALVKKLRGLGGFTCLETGIGVDSRRWQKDGLVKRTIFNRLLALGFGCGIKPERLASWYR